MKIPNTLPQFDDENVLLAVSGLQVGRFYFVASGEIKLIDEFSFSLPSYSDNEGHFKTRVALGVGVIRSGSVREMDRKENIKPFLKLYVEKVKKISEAVNIDEVYIFVPRQIKNSLFQLLPNQFKEKVKQVINGNYLDKHPLELLQLLAEARRVTRNKGLPLEIKADKMG